MVSTKAESLKIMILLAIIQIVYSLTASPILGDTQKYVNTATYVFNMAAYYNTTTTVLNPYIYTATFPTAYTSTTYHIGLSIQQMQYFIANKIINYTCWVDIKMTTGATVWLYTNTANKIAKLSIYLLIISPGFLDNYFIQMQLPISATLANGQTYSTTTSDGPYTVSGSQIWCTILGIDAKTGDNTNQIGLKIAVTLQSSTVVKIVVTAMTVKPFFLTSVTVNYFVYNNAQLLANTIPQQASYTWGQFSGTSPASPLSSPNALGYIRTYNTIVGITGLHILGDGFFQYMCNTSYSFAVSATSTNNWTFMSFQYIYLLFKYCADTTPYLMVATNTCYDICPIRYSSNTLDYQCDECPTYDCYYCGNNGLCTQCNSTLDFRILNNVTNRCDPLSGYYDNGVSQAVPCVATNCLTCTSATYCLSCPSGKFLKVTTHTCISCIANCLNCTSATGCTLCQPNYIFASPNCVLDCSPVANCSTCILSNATIQCTACKTGYSLMSNACSTVCGDGIVISPQQCDDGTTTGLNGCSSNCTVQNTYFCVNSPSSCSSCIAFCNTCTNASVCISCFTNYTYNTGSASCTIDCSVVAYCNTCNFTSEINCITCLTGFSLSSNICSSLCGDGILVIIEQCDDGNLVNGDGCSSNCTIEPTYYCTGTINSTSLCSNCQPNCLNCSNNNSCSVCDTGYTFNSTNCTIDCSSITYCVSCFFSAGVSCTDCLIGYYANSSGSSCYYTCGDGIKVTEEQCDDGNLNNNDGCSSICILQIGFFCNSIVVNVTANQTSCSACMPDCYNCTNITSCIQCNTDYVFNNSACTIDCSTINYCSACNFTTSLNCLSCSTGYIVQSNICKPVCGDGIKTVQQSCDDGNILNNDGCSSLCTLEPFFYCNTQFSNTSSTLNTSACFPCLSNCQSCNTGIDCNTCAAGYSYNLVGANVSCDVDCSELLYCAVCIPGACTVCAPYYLLNSSNKCQPICGDGIVLFVQQCDDGNLIDGDGCSNTCLTQSNFQCYNTPMRPSLCSLLNFTIQLNTIIKDQNANSIIITYQLTPITLPAYQTANWSQIIYQESKLDIKFTSFSYDPSSGLLSINTDYNQNIQQQDIVLGFNFPPTSPFDMLPPTKTTTKLVSTNNLLLQNYSDQSYAQAKIVGLISLALSCLALLLFILGYFSSKLIGLELITIFQLTFFSLITVDNLSPTLDSLYFLSYSCGYNIHTLVKAQVRMNSRFMPVKLTQAFLNNYNLTFIIIILPLLISLILTLVNRFAYKSKHQKLSKYQMLTRAQYVFYGLMFSAYSIAVAAGIQVLYLANLSGVIYAGLAMSAILLGFFIAYSILIHKKPQIFGQFTQKFNKSSFVQSHYYCFLVAQRIITSCVVLVFMVKPQSAIIITILAIQIIVILCKKPYAGETGYRRPVLNLCISILIQLAIILIPTLSSIPSYKVYSAFVILGLLAVSLAYNIYYFIQDCRTNSRLNQQLKLQEEQNFFKKELAKAQIQISIINDYNNLLNGQNVLDNSMTSPLNLNLPNSPTPLNSSNISYVKKELNKLKQTSRTNSNNLPEIQLTASFSYPEKIPDDLDEL